MSFVKNLRKDRYVIICNQVEIEGGGGIDEIYY